MAEDMNMPVFTDESEKTSGLLALPAKPVKAK